MIPNGTKVRVRNVHKDTALDHVAGFDGEVVYSYFLCRQYTHHTNRRYLVCVCGLDYDLTADELEVL